MATASSKRESLRAQLRIVVSELIGVRDKGSEFQDPVYVHAYEILLK